MRREELNAVLGIVKKSLKPYIGRFPANTRLPAKGRPRDEILDEIRAMKAEEQRVWSDGYVSGAVYHGDQEFIGFLNDVYALNAELNPLHPDVWCQIHADVLKRPVHRVAEPLLANVKGAAIFAGLVLGDVRHGEVTGLARIDATFEPRPETFAVYDELYREYPGLHHRQRKMYARLNGGKKTPARA